MTKRSKHELLMLAAILICNDMIMYGLKYPDSDIGKLMRFPYE